MHLRESNISEQKSPRSSGKRTLLRGIPASRTGLARLDRVEVKSVTTQPRSVTLKDLRYARTGNALNSASNRRRRLGGVAVYHEAWA